MSLVEQIRRDLLDLNEPELQQVADYLAFLRYRGRRSFMPKLDEQQLAVLYAEFEDEDRASSEEGLEEYVADLAKEDVA